MQDPYYTQISLDKDFKVNDNMKCFEIAPLVLVDYAGSDWIFDYSSLSLHFLETIILADFCDSVSSPL